VLRNVGGLGSVRDTHTALARDKGGSGGKNCLRAGDLDFRDGLWGWGGGRVLVGGLGVLDGRTPVPRREGNHRSRRESSSWPGVILKRPFFCAVGVLALSIYMTNE
jgi:hypothetical protein